MGSMSSAPMSSDPTAGAATQPAGEPACGPRAGSSIAAAAALIAGVTFVSRLVGFGRTLVFAGSVGATPAGNAYQTANTLPNVVYEVAAGGVLAAVAIPLVSGHLGGGDRAAADQTSSALLTWAITILAPVAVLLAALSPWLSGLLLRDSSPGAVPLGRHLLLIFSPQVLLYGIGIVLTGILQSHRRFLAAALAPLLSSLVVIATYLTYGAVVPPGRPAVISGATTVLAVGTTLGVVVLSLPLLVPTWRAGVRLRPTWAFPQGSAHRVGALALAGVLALAAQQAAVFVTLLLTNVHGGSGTVNVYQYAQAVYLLPYAVLAVPVATSAFPALAHAHGSGQPVDTTLATALRVIVVLSAAGAAVLVAVARPVGSFFLALDAGADHGGHAALSALPTTLVSYAPGLVGFSAAALLTRALYVRGRPTRAAMALCAGWLVAALVPVLVLGGDAGPDRTLRVLGLASSAGMTLSAAALAVQVRRRWGNDALAGLVRTLTAAIVAAVVGAVAGWWMANVWAPGGAGMSVLAGVVVAAAATLLYAVVLALLDRSTLALAAARVRRG